MQGFITENVLRLSWVKSQQCWGGWFWSQLCVHGDLEQKGPVVVGTQRENERWGGREEREKIDIRGEKPGAAGEGTSLLHSEEKMLGKMRLQITEASTTTSLIKLQIQDGIFLHVNDQVLGQHVIL